MKTKMSSLRNYQIALRIFLSALVFVATTYLTAAYVFKSHNAIARPARNCEISVPHFAGEVEVYYSKIAGECAVFATPQNKPGLVYRSYLFTDSGLFQIFNSFDETENHNATGVRAYFFLPRQNKVTFKLRKDGDLQIETAAGRTVIIEAKDARLKKITDAKFEESIDVKPENNGGVELVEAKFLFIDTGFAFGDSPYTDPDRHSTIHDSEGRICDLQNSELFTLAKGEARLKSDLELAQILSKSCPLLEPL